MPGPLDSVREVTRRWHQRIRTEEAKLRPAARLLSGRDRI